jgi:hypothetical protein
MEPEIRTKAGTLLKWHSSATLPPIRTYEGRIGTVSIEEGLDWLSRLI